MPDREPKVVQVGRVCLGLGMGGVLIGNTTIAIWFPHLRGTGLNEVLLCVLVPIWLLGIVGLVLLLVGWIAYPGLAPQLRLRYPRRPDGSYFGPLVRVLAVLVCTLMMFGVIAMCFEDSKTMPPVTRIVVGYSVICINSFIVYLCIIYRENRDVATTTYLNLFTPLFAYILVPLTWPLLLVLNARVTNCSQSSEEEDASDLRRLGDR